jgi:hypothetical protein
MLCEAMQGGGAELRGEAQLGHTGFVRAAALIGSGGCLAVACTPGMAATAAWPCPARERAAALVAGLIWAKTDWVGLTDAGSAQNKRKGLLFPKYFSVKKQFQKNLENVQRHEKYLETSQYYRKIPRDTLEHEQSK